MKKPLLFLMMFFLLSFSVTAQSVTEHDVTISSPQETYYCQPVLSADGCLIQTQTTITNNRAGNIATRIYFDSNKAVALRDFKTDGQSIAVEKSRGKNIHSLNTDIISSGQTKTYDIEFYANEDGKYNMSVFFNGNWVILDPFFNVTYNATSPTLHLKTGRVSTFNDSQFNQQINITTGVSDSLDSTTFIIQKKNIGSTAASLRIGARFDETSGTIAQDYSDLSLDGTYFNSP